MCQPARRMPDTWSGSRPCAAAMVYQVALVRCAGACDVDVLPLSPHSLSRPLSLALSLSPSHPCSLSLYVLLISFAANQDQDQDQDQDHVRFLNSHPPLPPSLPSSLSLSLSRSLSCSLSLSLFLFPFLWHVPSIALLQIRISIRIKIRIRKEVWTRKDMHFTRGPSLCRFVGAQAPAVRCVHWFARSSSYMSR